MGYNNYRTSSGGTDNLSMMTAFADNLKSAWTDTDDAAKKAVGVIAKTLKDDVNVRLRAISHGSTDAGGGIRLHGMPGRGKQGAPVGAQYTAPVGSTTFSSVVRMYGPAQLIERDTKAHRVPNLLTRATQRRRIKKGLNPQRRLFIPGVGWRMPRGGPDFKNHPGTHGKHIWDESVATVSEVAPAIYDEVVFGAFARHFK